MITKLTFFSITLLATHQGEAKAPTEELRFLLYNVGNLWNYVISLSLSVSPPLSLSTRYMYALMSVIVLVSLYSSIHIDGPQCVTSSCSSLSLSLYIYIYIYIYMYVCVCVCA